jgi:hypothetical protein
MRRSKLRSVLSAALACCLLTGPGIAYSRIECMNRGGDALPADAYAVPVSRAAELQGLLAAHGQIRLDPAGDYRRATGITIRSGQAIFGAAGTRIGRLIVAPGTRGAIVSGVVPESLEFPPSTLVTRDNCFERFASRNAPQAPLTLRDVFVENNLFLDVGPVVVDTSRSGRVQGNRFIRMVVHGSSPALQLSGRESGGDRNVFLWSNFLSAVGDAIVVKRQAQVNFVGLDAEDWNQRGMGSNPAMLSVTRSGTVRAFMPQGGDSKARPNPFMDVEAQRFELVGMRLYRSGEPAIRLREPAATFISILASGQRVHEDSQAGSRLLAYPDWTDRVDLRGEFALPASEASITATAWEAPVFEPIPAPAGVDWREQRKLAPDSAAELQRLIDQQGIAKLPAGIFFISQPLRLKRGQGIIGAGTSRTAIVAKSDDFDLIVGADEPGKSGPTSLVLIDLTLQGGRSGIRHDAHGSGSTAQYVYTHLSHVLFRDMTESGITIDGIYGWDNNLLDNLTFHRLPVGIRQVPNPAYISAEVSGNIPGVNYLDKNVCYRCRFEQVDTGLELIAKRANNLNACVNCRFADNRRGAIRLRYNGSTLIANSDFIGNGGDPVIASDQPVGIVSSRFHAGAGGSLLDTDAVCEACEFTAVASSRASIAKAGARVVLLNSRAHGIGIGGKVSGLLVDSPVGTTARVLQLSGGRELPLLRGEPRPAPGLLVDWEP